MSFENTLYDNPGQKILTGVTEYFRTVDTTIDLHYVRSADRDVTSESYRRIAGSRRRRWKGVLLIYPFARPVVDELLATYPVISLVEQYGSSSLNCVDVDHYRGISRVVDALIAAGHRRIGFFTWKYGVEAGWALRRYSAYLEKLTAVGFPLRLEDAIIAKGPDKKFIEQARETVLQRTRDGVTAWICAADQGANQDAAQIAEAQAAIESSQTADTQESIREEAAQSWRDGRDQAINLFSQLEKSEGKMQAARIRIGNSKAKLARTLEAWLGEVTDGVENADLAIERMYLDAAGDPEAFADIGGEAASWVVSLADNRSLPALPSAPAAPAIEAAAALGKKGGKAATGKAKARTTEQANTPPPAPTNSATAFSNTAAGLWETIITKAKGDVDSAAGILERGSGTVTVEGKKVKLSDIRDALADLGIGLTEATNAYDTAQNFEEFESLLRGGRAQRLDEGGMIAPDDFLKRLPQIAREDGAGESAGIRQAGQIAEAARRAEEINARASGARQGSPVETRRVKQAEATALRSWSIANGGLIDQAEFERDWKEQGSRGGEEHQVIFRGDRVYKRGFAEGVAGEMVLPFHTSYTDYFERMAIHNALFPATAYRLEGFVETAGGLAPVVSQRAVIGKPAPRAAVEAEMAKLGFARTGSDNYRNADGLIIEDLHDENVVIDERDGQLAFIDPVIFYRPGNLRQTSPGEVAEQNANTQRAIERLRYRGVNTLRVAQIMGSPSATGAQFSPNLIAVALDDVAFGRMQGLVTVIHEGGHALFAQLPDATQAKVSSAAARAMDKLRAQARTASNKTGVRVASNFDLNPEEALVETTAQEIAAAGVVESQSIAGALWRWAKEVYLRSASALLQGVGVTDPRIIDSLTLGWWDNQLRRTMGGDFEWAFINILDRFLPASPADRVTAQENSDNTTPGNLPEFIDPLTGVLINPADARFREEAVPAGFTAGGLDLDRQTAWDRLEGASLNEVIPSLERAKKEAAPDMDDVRFWKLVGKGDNPATIREKLESRTPGSISARLGGDGMTKPMNERGAERALRRVKLLRNVLDSRIASRTERINKASDQLLAQSDKTAKMEAEYRNAGVLEESLRDRLRGMTRDMLRALDQGMKVSREAGRMGEAIANAEGLDRDGNGNHRRSRARRDG